MNSPRKESVAIRWLRRSVSPMLWLALMAALPCAGQFSSPNGGQTGNQRPTRGAPTPDMDQPMTPEMGDQVYREKRLQQLNAAQHKSMVADTDKLLKLVTELNSEIENSNSSSLTPQQLKKIAEIEKLAHNVKDKMRMSVKGSADNMGSSPIPLYNPH